MATGDNSRLSNSNVIGDNRIVHYRRQTVHQQALLSVHKLGDGDRRQETTLAD